MKIIIQYIIQDLERKSSVLGIMKEIERIYK